MANKSLKIHLKNDRVEQVEALTLRTEQALNNNICRLGKDILEVRDALDLIYDELIAVHARLKVTWWMRLKWWIKGL